MGNTIGAHDVTVSGGEVIARAGTLDVRLAASGDDVRAAQALRFDVFYEELGARGPVGGERIDRDRFDDICDHLIVVDHGTGEDVPRVVGTYRLLPQPVAERSGGFYGATEFDIADLLKRKGGRFLEAGRSCVHADYRNRPTIELLWRGIFTYADRHGSEVIMGCASLPGANPQLLKPQMSVLHHTSLAPEDWRVRPHENVRVETNVLAEGAYDAKTAFRALPPLIKGYVRIGGWFSDGAYADRRFRTTDLLYLLPRERMSPRYRARLGVGSWGA